MRTATVALMAGAAGLAINSGAFGQSRYLVLDRTAQVVWALDDLNGNNQIDEPGELSVYFSNAGNASGITMGTPGVLAVRPSDGLVAIGDSGTSTRGVFLLRDFNHDNSAQGAGEAWAAFTTANASALPIAAPGGVAFDNDGNLYVTMSGNGNGPDIIYKLHDSDGDGKFQSAGEATVFVGAPVFGSETTNGSFVPADIALDLSVTPFVGYMHDSGASTHGVYRFSDTNGNGRADDTGEFTPFFTSANAGALSIGAGFAMELDAARPGAVYILQTATTPTRQQLLRLRDNDGNGTANDAGEATVVWQTTESGFTPVDLISLADGRVLITDGTGKRVILLTDANSDGLFDNTTERTTFFGNTGAMVLALRQIAVMPRFCQANCDDSTISPVLNVADFTCFLQRYAAGDLYANCDSSTIPPVLNVADFTCFLQAYAAGCQ